MLYIEFYLLFCLCILFIQGQQTTIKLPYTLINDGVNIDLNQESRSQKYSLRIDQYSSFTWISSLLERQRNSKTKKMISQEPIAINYLPNDKTYADLYVDLITIEDNNIELAYFVPTSSKKDDNGLTFAYRIENPSFSLVHSLYNKKMIDKLSYAVVPENKNKGFIYFGELPFITNDTFSQRLEGKCKIINERWSCPIIGGNIGRFMYYSGVLSNETIFQLGEKTLYVPKSFLEFVVRSLNIHVNRNKKCKMKASNNKDYYFINCYSGNLVKGKNITLNIGDYKYTLPLENFFTWNNGDLISTMLYNEKKCLNVTNKKRKHCWIIGSDFLLNYISVFDYEDSSISLISKDSSSLIEMRRSVDYMKYRKKQLFIKVGSKAIKINIIILSACALYLYRLKYKLMYFKFM